jgi:ribosomal 50S subunit-recycling heat shock protein
MRSMKITLVAVVLCLAVTFPAFSQQKASAPKPGIEFGEVVVVTGKVVAIDRTDRSVAVQGQEGNVLVLEVGKAAKNFNQIKVGDQVKLEYYEAVAIYVGAGGKPPQENVAVIAATAPKGMKPEGEVIEVVDVSATIQALDAAKRTLTIKGPHGNVIPLKVDKSVKAFDQLKVGDSIHVRYTEAVAISVSKP